MYHEPVLHIATGRRDRWTRRNKCVQTGQTNAALCEAVLERVFEVVTRCLFQVGIYIERGSRKMRLQLSKRTVKIFMVCNLV
jgi:hypothetical protein